MQFDRESLALQVGASGRLNGLESYERWARERNPLDLTVFSDGSVNKAGKAGAGYCVYRGSQEILYGKVPLGHTAQIYDAEIIGAVAGLRAACSHFMARFATNVAVCLDNEEAAIRLHSGWLTPSSSHQITEFQNLRETWARRERAAAANIGNVQIRWIPGHKGIAGNTRADTLAKQACNSETTRSEASIASAYRLLEERYNEVLASYWDLNAPKRYKDLQIGMSSRIPAELFIIPRR
ncbi:hypothetical protein K3495_g16617, partial [Podosphaera aphanis]